MSASLTLEQVCYSSLPKRGWTIFGASAGLSETSLIQEHCLYHDVWPPRFTESDPIIDYGFRMLGTERGCFYRMQRPAGQDEFQREVHLVHNFVLSREDLVAVDFDIPALFAWAEQNGAFLESREDAIAAVEDHPEGLPQIQVDLETLKSWSRENAEYSPSSRLTSWSPSIRKNVAKVALRLMLTPQEGAVTRPVIWIAPDDGRTQGRQEFEVIEFLYLVLPRAWRESMSFSTYRPFRALERFRWMSTCLDDQQFSDDQRRHQFYVVDWRAKLSLRGLPNPEHSWIEDVAEHLDEPFNESKVGRALALANGMECQSAPALVNPKGFLAWAKLCSRILDGKGEDFSKALDHLLKTASEKRPEVLDRLLESLVKLDEERLSMNLEKIVQTLSKLLQQQTSEDLTDAERTEHILEGVQRTLLNALDNPYAWNHATDLMRLLGRPQFESVRNRIVPVLVDYVDQLQDVEDEGRRRVVLDLVTFLGTWFCDLPTDHPERRAFGDCARQQILRSIKMLSEQQLKEAENTLFPYLETHDPGSVQEIAEVLELLNYVQFKGGPDLQERYVERACHNCSDLRKLDSLFTSNRMYLVRDLPVWRGSKQNLPKSLANELHEFPRSQLVTTWWSASNDSPRRLQFFTHVAEEIRNCNDEEANDVVKAYADSGASAVTTQLEEKGIRHYEVYDAHLALIELVGGRCSPSETAFALHGQHVAMLLNCVQSALLNATDERLQGWKSRLKKLLDLIHKDRDSWNWSNDDKWNMLRTVSILLAQSMPPDLSLTKESIPIWKNALAHGDELECCCIEACLGEAYDIRDATIGFDEEKVIATLLFEQSELIMRGTSEFAEFLKSQLANSPTVCKELRKRAISLIRKTPRQGGQQWLANDSAGWPLLSICIPPGQQSRFVESFVRKDSEESWRAFALILQATAGSPLSEEIRICLEREFLSFIRKVVDRKRSVPNEIWSELSVAVAAVQTEEHNIADFLLVLIGRANLDPLVSKFAEGNLKKISKSLEHFQRGRTDVGGILQKVKVQKLFVLAKAACRSSNSGASTVQYLKQRADDDPKVQEFLGSHLTKVGSLEPPYDDLRTHARMAAMLWSDKPDKYGTFLAHVGDGFVGKKGKSRPHKDGIKFTAIAIGTILLDGERDDARLDAMCTAWEKEKRERIKKGKHWKQFVVHLQEELQGTGISAENVQKALKNSRQSRWKRPSFLSWFGSDKKKSTKPSPETSEVVAQAVEEIADPAPNEDRDKRPVQAVDTVKPEGEESGESTV